jgi:hypothetical protein
MGGVDTPPFSCPHFGAQKRRGREGFMPTRIKARDKNIASPQKPKISGVRGRAMFDSQAFYTDIETVLGMLCGSV